MKYYSGTTLIGTGVHPSGAIKTVDGQIPMLALVGGSQNGRYYISGRSIFFFDRFLDSNCTIPIIANTTNGDGPTAGSIMNVFNGYTKFIGGGGTTTYSNTNQWGINGGNTGICEAKGTFSNTIWSPSNYQIINLSFPTSNINTSY